jgi:hypothetical protein
VQGLITSKTHVFGGDICCTGFSYQIESTPDLTEKTGFAKNDAVPQLKLASLKKSIDPCPSSFVALSATTASAQQEPAADADCELPLGK